MAEPGAAWANRPGRLVTLGGTFWRCGFGGGMGGCRGGGHADPHLLAVPWRRASGRTREVAAPSCPEMLRHAMMKWLVIN